VNQDIPCSHFHHFDEILADLRKEIRGVIFDLDGTLIEAYEAIYLAMAEAFRYFNRPFYPYSDLKQHLKVDLEASLAPFFSQEEMHQAIPVIRKKYEEIYLEKTHFIDGARAILEGLHRKDLALAVATNKFGRFARGVLRHLGVSNFFRSILGAGDGVRNKPFPDMIRISLGEMNLPRENVVFIGDSVEDIETGKKAGVDVFSIPTGVHTKEELSQGHPKRVLRNLEELLTITNQPPFFPRS
jgi:HAD superfamily hydrolase (TIGR01509 family)